MRSDLQIMLVEDDASLGFLLKDSLESAGWNVHLYNDGVDGFSAFQQNPYDLCILDIMLPGKDGYDLARDIRNANKQIPIIFLTAKSQTEDKIRGFQTGADDYVCKPFSIDEFKYRIEAIIKRTSQFQALTDNSNIVRLGDSYLDLQNLVLTIKGNSNQLTYKEAKLLEIFFRHPNELIGREIFLKTVWENDGFFVARSMDVFISRLRKYLKPDTNLKIENIRSVGYILKQFL